VVSEASPLSQHLKNLGISEPTPTDPSNISIKRLSSDHTANSLSSLGKHIFEEISVLRETRLIFEDDLVHISCVLANYRCSSGEMLRWMFRGTTSALVVALGLCLFVFIGSYAFVLVSAFYAYRTSDFLWRKHRRLLRVNRLMSTLRSNFDVTNKSIKFVLEQERIINCKVNGLCSRTYIVLVDGFKNEVIFLQKKINKLLIEAISRLADDVPLPLSFQHRFPDVHNFSEGCETSSISQLYNRYMLLQSHFLARLIFSTIPNLPLKPEYADLKIAKVIHKLTVSMEVVQNFMARKLNLALINGCCVENNVTLNEELRAKRRDAKTDSDELTRNVHDLSNSLQYSLMKARDLEGNLEKKISADPEKELQDILHEINNCQSHVEQLIILQSKRSVSSQVNAINNEENIIEVASEVPTYELGFPDLDPEVDDDIFETFTTDSLAELPTSEWNGEEFDPLLKKKHKEVLGELKGRLKEQAEDWARRELKVCERKGIAPAELPAEPDIIDGNEEVEAARDDGMTQENENFAGDRMTLGNDNFGDSSSDDDDRKDFVGRQSALAAALLKVRSNMFTDTMQEDNFSGSGENSEGEM